MDLKINIIVIQTSNKKQEFRAPYRNINGSRSIIDLILINNSINLIFNSEFENMKIISVIETYLSTIHHDNQFSIGTKQKNPLYGHVLSFTEIF